MENAKKLISSAELKNNQTILKDGASQYARLAILKEIVKEVGEENIGIRQRSKNKRHKTKCRKTPRRSV